VLELPTLLADIRDHVADVMFDMTVSPQCTLALILESTPDQHDCSPEAA